MPFLDEWRWYEINSEFPEAPSPRPGIFLDRDGVIIEEKHYLKDPDQVRLHPGVAEAIRALLLLNAPIVVVTNQSGIGQGLFGWPEFHAVHRRMLDLLGLEHPFAGVYANGHRPTESEASWRKPNPGMFHQAAADLNIELGSSVMVGDKVVDLQAAERAGVKRLVHVRTGHGNAERLKVVTHYAQAELLDSLADFNPNSPALRQPS